MLGLQARRSSPPATPYAASAGSYTQNLLARFYLPSARAQAPEGSATTTPSDIYNLITSVMGHKSTTSSQDPPSSAASHDTSGDVSSGTKEERMNYIKTQSDRLRWLLQVLDKEAAKANTNTSSSVATEQATATGRMKKNKSEPDFENVEREDVADHQNKETGTEKNAAGAGGWMPWNWWSGASGDDAGAGAGANVKVPTVSAATAATATPGENSSSSGGGSDGSSIKSTPTSSPSRNRNEAEVGRSSGADL